MINRHEAIEAIATLIRGIGQLERERAQSNIPAHIDMLSYHIEECKTWLRCAVDDYNKAVQYERGETT